MDNALVAKMSKFSDLCESDILAIERVCSNQREVPANHDLAREGEGLNALTVILQGWACRYKTFLEGTRQITGFLLPGDCCDTHISVLDVMDHDISTLTRCRVASVPRARVEELLATRADLARGFYWSQLVAEDTLRAWMANMGRRTSVQRVAHLMCELYTRGRDVGLVRRNSLALELTHAVIGDALGLTAVHVCRVLKKLRLTGYMELKSGFLTISDLDALARLAGFDGGYLHQPVREQGRHLNS